MSGPFEFLWELKQPNWPWTPLGGRGIALQCADMLLSGMP